VGPACRRPGARAQRVRDRRRRELRKETHDCITTGLPGQIARRVSVLPGRSERSRRDPVPSKPRRRCLHLVGGGGCSAR
jgi:hypothetical protein